MNAEGKGRRQKAVIGIVATVIIAVLFTVTIGIGMNNGDTGNSIAAKSDLEIAQAGDGEISGTLFISVDPQRGVICSHGLAKQVIYEGTYGFFITITADVSNIEKFYVEYYVDGEQVTRKELFAGQSITLSDGFGKGELKRIEVHGHLSPGVYDGDYLILLIK
jgi:hypothetical protein